MAKKKSKKHSFRNAGPRAPKADDETSFKRLAYTAGGAAGTALAVSFLKREGWAPKTAATTLTAVGAGLTWKGDAPTIRSLGAGVMAGAGSQLAMMMLADRDPAAKTVAAASTLTPTSKRLSNSDGASAAALEAALERARSRVALSAGGID